MPCAVVGGLLCALCYLPTHTQGDLGGVVSSGLVTSCLVYLTVALAVTLYFGSGIDSSCNVTW